VVLAALGIAAFAFAIHALFSYLIIPTIKYMPNVLGQFGIAFKRLTLADAASAALQIGIGLLGAVVFLGITRVFGQRWHAHAKKTAAEMESLVADCKAFTDKNHEDLYKVLAETKLEGEQFLAATRVTADEMMAQAKETQEAAGRLLAATEAKLLEMIARAKSATPSHQSPPSTESEKQP
jgi:cell division septum initiation protein DivIVA